MGGVRGVDDGTALPLGRVWRKYGSKCLQIHFLKFNKERRKDGCNCCHAVMLRCCDGYCYLLVHNSQHYLHNRVFDNHIVNESQLKLNLEIGIENNVFINHER